MPVVFVRIVHRAVFVSPTSVLRPSYCRGIVPVRADLNAHDDLDCLDAKDTVHGDR